MFFLLFSNSLLPLKYRLINSLLQSSSSTPGRPTINILLLLGLVSAFLALAANSGPAPDNNLEFDADNDFDEAVDEPSQDSSIEQYVTILPHGFFKITSWSWSFIIFKKKINT